MEKIRLELIFAGMLILLSIASGIWLHHKDRPLNKLIFNVHKFISLGAIVLIGLATIAFYKLTPFDNTEVIFIVLTTLFLLLTLISGGILSAKEAVSFVMLMVHRIATIFVLVSGIYTFYILANTN